MQSRDANLPVYRRVFGSAFLQPAAQQQHGVEWQSRLRHVYLVGVIVDVDKLPFKFVRFALDDGSMTAASCARPAPSTALFPDPSPAPFPAPSPAPPRTASARVSAPSAIATPPARLAGALPVAAPQLSTVCATRPVRAVPCVLWLNSRDHAERHVAMLQAATCVHVGALVGVRGRVMVFNGRRQVTVDAVCAISDPNEEILHWLDCLEITHRS
ncbi:unnamed protein product [Closterium sp. NIES-53]